MFIYLSTIPSVVFPKGPVFQLGCQPHCLPTSAEKQNPEGINTSMRSLTLETPGQLPPCPHLGALGERGRCSSLLPEGQPSLSNAKSLRGAPVLPERKAPVEHLPHGLHHLSYLLRNFAPSPLMALLLTKQDTWSTEHKSSQRNTHLLKCLLLLWGERRKPQLGCCTLSIFHLHGLCALRRQEKRPSAKSRNCPRVQNTSGGRD